jgi:nucleoside-diphosphate-sugar epimerase
MPSGDVSEEPARRIAVTGAAGFIGSHFAEAFHTRDYEVGVIDDLSAASEAKGANPCLE